MRWSFMFAFNLLYWMALLQNKAASLYCCSIYECRYQKLERSLPKKKIKKRKKKETNRMLSAPIDLSEKSNFLKIKYLCGRITFNPSTEELQWKISTVKNATTCQFVSISIVAWNSNWRFRENRVKFREWTNV